MVLTRIAWAAIVTSAQMVSYDLQTKTWHSWLTFLLYKFNLSIEPMANVIDMNRLLILASVLSVGFSLSSCRDDNTVFNEPTPIRAYETDAQILLQFVEVENSTGKFVINPNKKINASDYIVNRSREQLTEVAPFNRDRFLREMEDINGLLHSIRQSGIATAMIYSTVTSNSIIQGNNTDFIEIEKLGVSSRGRSDIANLIVDSKKCEPTSFYASDEMTMNVSASCKSLFYYYQLSFGDAANPDKGIVIFSGVRNPRENNSYRITSKSGNGWMSIGGQNLVGDGTLSVSVSK